MADEFHPGAHVVPPTEGSARIVMRSTVRNMKTYILVDTEWDQLTDINNRAVIFTSVAATATTLAFETTRDLAGLESKTPVQEILLSYGVPACAALAVLFAFLSFLAFRSRKSLRHKIEEQTATIQIKDAADGPRQVSKP